jgi:tetratricopeptide (TPR) repeat protein
MMGKSEEALKDVQKALDLDPDNQNAIETKQEILKALGGTGNKI